MAKPHCNPRNSCILTAQRRFFKPSRKSHAQRALGFSSGSPAARKENYFLQGTVPVKLPVRQRERMSTS
jgi:hypothetical protein